MKTTTRRDLLKKAVYITPAVLSLPALPAIAQTGSGGEGGNGNGAIFSCGVADQAICTIPGQGEICEREMRTSCIPGGGPAPDCSCLIREDTGMVQIFNNGEAASSIVVPEDALFCECIIGS